MCLRVRARLRVSPVWFPLHLCCVFSGLSSFFRCRVFVVYYTFVCIRFSIIVVPICFCSVSPLVCVWLPVLTRFVAKFGSIFFRAVVVVAGNDVHQRTAQCGGHSHRGGERQAAGDHRC